MRITNSDVTIEVPATSANLGPGYDCLGLALSLYDRVKVRATVGKTKVHITGQGENDLPRDESHLIVKTLRAALDLVGASQIGIEMWCHNRIPQSRGLGSSACAIVAGLALARGLISEPEALDQEAMLKIATAIEGHPDNLAPAIYGGITAAGIKQAPVVPIQGGADLNSPFLLATTNLQDQEIPAEQYDQRRNTLELLNLGHRSDLLEEPSILEQLPEVWCAPIQPHPDFKVTVFVPSFRLDTARARSLLPTQVPHQDASANSAHAALLVLALQNHPDQLFEATREYLHQEYRRTGMPASLELMEWLRRREYPAVISGAGPTVLVLSAVPASVQIQARNSGWDAKTLSLDTAGVRQV